MSLAKLQKRIAVNGLYGAIGHIYHYALTIPPKVIRRSALY